MALLFKSRRNRQSVSKFQVGGSMASVPVYAYYTPQYTPYQPTDLAAMYEKYAAVAAKKKSKDKAKVPEIKQLEGAGLSNENRYVAKELASLRNQMEQLSLMGGEEYQPMINQLYQQYTYLAATGFQENKNNKELWDKQKADLDKQLGSNVLYFDPSKKSFFAEVFDIEPETEKVISKDYLYLRPGEELQKLMSDKTKKVNLLTFGELGDKLANDDYFIRKPDLIGNLSYGMDLNYIKKEFITPALSSAKTTKLSGSNTVGGFLDKSGQVISEITSGGTTEDNYTQLNEATNALYTNLRSEGGGKPWASLMSYAYQQTAKRYVKEGEGKKAKYKLVEIGDDDKPIQPGGKPRLAQTEEEAELNVKLYLVGQSEQFKQYTKDTQSKQLIDFKTTFNLKKSGGTDVTGIVQNISPVFFESTTWDQADFDFTQFGKAQKDDGKRIVIKTQSKEVPNTKKDLQGKKNFVNKSTFTAGDLSKTQLEDGKFLTDIKIAYDRGSWDGKLTGNLGDYAYLNGNKLKLVRLFADPTTGKKITFDKLTTADKKNYYAKVKEFVEINKKDKLGLNYEAIKSKALEAAVAGKYTVKEFYLTQTIVNKKSLENTGVNSYLLNEKPSEADINEYLTKLGGSVDAGADIMNDYTGTGINYEDYGLVNVYIPFNPIGANSTGPQAGSLKYKTGTGLENIILYGTPTKQ
jgi:hypothetical protein